MEYQILAIGLKQDQYSHCTEHFAKTNARMKTAKSIPDAAHILKEETNHLLVLDMEYLRSISQSDWITNIRYYAKEKEPERQVILSAQHEKKPSIREHLRSKHPDQEHRHNPSTISKKER